MNEAENKRQQSQQTFVQAIIQQQQAHTQALIQSQMTFQASLFEKHFGEKN